MFVVFMTFGAILLYENQAWAQRADAAILVARAVLAYHAGRHAEALTVLNQAILLDPQDPRGLYYKGLISLAQRKPDLAIEAFKKAATLQPGNLQIQFQLGVAYFTLGKYEEAEPLLENVFQQKPDWENLGYYVGFIRYRQKSYPEAITAFKALQTVDPNIRQLAYFYQGLALGVLGLPEQAIAELEEVQRAQAVSPITGTAVRIREALAARRKLEPSKRFHLQVTMGGTYDDNVAVNPDAVGLIPHRFTDTLPNPNTTIQNLRSRKTGAAISLISLQGDYSFYREGPLEGRVSYSFLQNFNFNGLDRFNIQDHLPGIAGFYRGVFMNLPYQLGSQYTFDYLLLDNNPFLSRHTPTLTATIVPPVFSIPNMVTVANLTTVILRYEVKAFFRESGDFDPRFGSERRDGFNTMYGFLHAFRFDNDRYILRFGYQYDNENTDGSAFSYGGHRFLTGGQISIPWGDMSLRYDYDVHWRGYKSAQSLFVDRDGFLSVRDDTQQTHLVQLIKPLPNNFSLTLQYQGIRSESNIPIYDYTKNMFSVLGSWTY